MANAELIRAIRNEIERLKTVQLKRIQEGDLVDAEPYDKNEAYNDLLSFLDTLESEKPMDQDGLDKEIEKVLREGALSWNISYSDMCFIAEHFYELGKNSVPLPEDTVLFNKGVEEGRRLAEEEQADLFTIVALDAAQSAKEQMMKDGNVILAEEDFNAEKEKSMEWCYNLCKEQMLKDAVEGEVVQDLKGVNRVKSFGKIPEGLHFGDKVRIIIVKED